MARWSKPFTALALSAVATLTTVGTRPALADEYKVDPVHSFISFTIQHNNTGYTQGRFNSFSGMVKTDTDPTKTSFSVSADVDSIDTANEKRNTHLKTPDFFSASEFPKITFTSTAVKAAADGKLEVTGDLSLHGQTKPITVTFTKTGETNTKMFGQRVGYLTTFTVKRTDFGMSKMTDMIGDEVQLTVGLEAQKQ